MSPHSDSPLRILVTGAAGFIGSHTVDLLLEHGHEVMGIDDLSRGRRANVQAARARGFRLVDDDLLSPGLLDEAVGCFRPEVILHLAALTGIETAERWPIRARRLNVEATDLVVRTAIRRGVSRVVLASSAAVYGEPEGERPGLLDPRSTLGKTKLEAEQILEEAVRRGDLTGVSARLFSVYGRRQDASAPQAGLVTLFAERCRRRQAATIFGDGRQRRDFLHVQDAARGLLMAGTRVGVPSGAYDLCSGTLHSVLEVAERFAAWFPGAPEPVFAPERAGEVTCLPGDPSGALEHLGFSASVSLGDGLQEVLGQDLRSLRRAA